MPCVNCQASTNVPPGGLSPDDICNGKYFNTNCVIYRGEPLTDIQAETNDSITTIFTRLDTIVGTIIAGSFTADNGLTKNTSTNVQLGGAILGTGNLIRDTYITNDGFLLRIDQSTATDSALYLNHSGTGLNVGTGLTSTAGGIAVRANSSESNAFEGVSLLDYTGLFIRDAASTNTVEGVIKIVRNSAGIVGGGIGGAIDFWIERRTTVPSPNPTEPTVRLAGVWASPGPSLASRLSRFDIYGYDGAVVGEKVLNLSLLGNGALTFYQYGIGTFKNTPTYGLGVDASGNVVETTGIVDFKMSLTDTDILTGGSFPINECPTLPAGYAWEIVSCSARLVGATTVYDGAPIVIVKADTSSKGQYTDNGIICSMGGDDFVFISRATENESGTVVESDKMVVNISASSTVGDGTLTIYGTARVITL